MSPLMLDSPPRRQPSPRSAGIFCLSPAKYDDIRQLVDIEFHAFRNEKTNQILSYRDNHQPAHLFRAVAQYQRAMSKTESTATAGRRRPQHQHHNAQKKAAAAAAAAARGLVLSATATTTDESNAAVDTRFRKITDTDAGCAISWAKTETKAYTRAELASPADVGHETDPRMNREWFALNERCRREYMGTERHCYLGMLATLPGYQHRGAGTMLLEAILADVDAQHLECYLEATDTAKPLYARHGFVEVTELRFDPTPYGPQGFPVERQTVMVRGALGPDGVRRPVRAWGEVRG